MKEIFEYRPTYNVDKPMKFEQLLEISGLEKHLLRYVLTDQNIKAEFKKGREAFYSIKDCNKVLNDPVFFRNWHIEGYYNLINGARLFGIPLHYIQKCVYEGKVPVKKHDFGRMGRTWISWSALEKLQSSFENKKTANIEKEKTETAKSASKKMPIESLESLFQAHPLVKDTRCFKLSWWPSVTPNCFESWEER